MGAMQQPDEHEPTTSKGEKEVAPLESEGPFANEKDPTKQVMPPEVLNGGNSLPPQQVYVNAPPDPDISNGITNLESQLMGLRMDPEAEPDEDGDAGDDSNDEDDDEPEIEPVKLFVGQVRNIMNSL